MAITPLPDAPTRNDPEATFVSKANALVAALGTFVTETNATASSVDADKIAAAQSVTDAAAQVALAETQVGLAEDQVALAVTARTAAETARDIAEGFANYQGDYDAGTFYAIGESVTYLGAVHVKKSTAAAGTTPIDGADWHQTGGLRKQSLSGASQTVDFSKDINVSSADALLVTYSFSTSLENAETTIIIDVGTTIDFDLFAYEGISFNSTGREELITGIAFNNDGTKYYQIGRQDGRVWEFELSTAYLISTATYSTRNYNIAEDNDTDEIGFSPDGTKMFVFGNQADRIFQYTLSTAFDVSTASYDTKSLDISAYGAGYRGFDFSADGAVLVVCADGSLYSFDLSTAFDISTATYDSTVSISAQTSAAVSMRFSPDGMQMFVLSTDDEINKYTLTTAYDIGTITHAATVSIAAQATSPLGLAIRPDLGRIYVGDRENTFQYTTEEQNSLVFPVALESDAIPSSTKLAMRIVTTDSGASYQAVSIQEITA